MPVTQDWLQPAADARRLEVAVLVGLQAAGKTTFYRQSLAGTHALVSRDLFRNHRRPSERQRTLVEAELRAGRSVAVDNTNPTPADRAAILAVARAFGARSACYYFPADVRACIARNAQREGRERVPLPGIYATRKRLVPPALAEGFDRLYEVEACGEGQFRVREVMSAEDGAARGGAGARPGPA